MCLADHVIQKKEELCKKKNYIKKNPHYTTVEVCFV